MVKILGRGTMSTQYLNNYRGVAILLVILSHSASTLDTANAVLINFISPIFGSGTLFFMLVAGQFFASFSDDYSYKQFLLNKLKFVVAPYVATSMPAALIYICELKTQHEWIDMEWFHGLNPVLGYLYLFVTGGHLGPLWFIPMILFYYLISPAFDLLIKRGWLVWAFVLSVVPAVCMGRPHGNSNMFQSAVYFLPPYMLGMILSGRGDFLKSLVRQPSLGLIVSVGGLLIFGKSLFLGLHWHLPFGLFAAAMLLNFMQSSLNYKIKLLDLMARLSFFLFFVHGYFVGYFRSVFRKMGVFSYPDLVVILVFVATLILCLMAYIPLKYKIKGRSRYLIGA